MRNFALSVSSLASGILVIKKGRLTWRNGTQAGCKYWILNTIRPSLAYNLTTSLKPLGNATVVRARTAATLAEAVTAITALGCGSLGRSQASLRTWNCLSLAVRVRAIVCAIRLTLLPPRLSVISRSSPNTLLRRRLRLGYQWLDKKHQN